MDSMRFFWLFNCFVLISGNGGGVGDNIIGSDEKKTFKAELFPLNRTCAGQTRMPRTLFKKLHSGASFLAGLKLGTILSKKGFELGHGKIASTHSFQVFGKSVNSAMSLSYGNSNSLLPTVDDVAEPDENTPSKRTSPESEDRNVFRVTVIENPSNETVENLKVLPLIVGDKTQDDVKHGTNEDVLVLYQDSVEEEPKSGIKSNFLKEHNKRVKEFNENILGIKNTKF